MPTIEEDREAILELHKQWWDANHGIVISEMQPVFPSGDSYLMFNLNGHQYFGIKEKTELWAGYPEQIDIIAYPEMQIMRLTVSGDMAWLACEGVFPTVLKEGGSGTGTWQLDENATENRLRATEIYQRDDGDGNPVWKMWHFHCSPLPDQDEPRPVLGGTMRERGLGHGPGITPLRVTSEGRRP